MLRRYAGGKFTPSFAELTRMYHTLGYPVPPVIPRKPMMPIITGWRRVGGKPNDWCDWISIAYVVSSVIPRQYSWRFESFKATTNPGIPYLLSPINPKGTAILKPGYYQDAWKLGWFRGEEALRQVRPVTVLRDNNKDAVLDPDTTDTGLFGIHIHRAKGVPLFVNKWSAGCQVIQSETDYNDFMFICKMASQEFNDAPFSYGLVEFDL